jgi:hypothetical protein
MDFCETSVYYATTDHSTCLIFNFLPPIITSMATIQYFEVDWTIRAFNEGS